MTVISRFRSGSANTLSALRPVGGLVARGTLAAIDLSHQFMLHQRQGERALPRTRRVRFTAEQRRRISSKQRNRCMYCGIRLNRLNLQIDHIYPAEFGGSNEESNLQALCGRCNARKGIQIDADFRARYREVLSGVTVGHPHSNRIPYERFDAITRRTSQGAMTQSLRRSVFRTPRQKIASGSVVLGAIAGGAWFIVMALVLPQSDVSQYIAFFGGAIFGLVTWGGSVWRAKHTDIWHRDE